MAKETLVKLIDDLDGGPAHETVQFGLDGHTYEIDLSTKNAKKLRGELAQYVDNGSKITLRPAGRSRSGAAEASGAGENRAIREWAIAKGYDVSARGRIKQGIVDEFHRTARR